MERSRRSPRSSEAVLAAFVGSVATTYVAYPAAIRVAAFLRRRRHRRPASGPLPTLTVVVPAHDEARYIASKLDELRADDYPPGLVDVLVVDDGSTDGTAALAAAAGARVLHRPDRAGKSAALDDGVRAARGDVVVFTDANASLRHGTLRAVASEFADPRVAVTTGAKHPVGPGAHGAGESLYWRLEAGVKRAESEFGCVMGADGGVYAVRRSAFRPIPEGVYADDYWLPLDALSRGLAVTQAEGAVAVEAVAGRMVDDFERRTRIAAGIWDVSLAHLGLADPRRGVVAAAFICHRLLRSIATPVLLVLALPAAAVARRRSPVARLLWWAQLAGYAGAAAGATTNRRAFAVPYEFVLVNAAAVRGGVRHLRHRQSARWAATTRGPWQGREPGRAA
jgi:cellulose synthase/poly-beta-1,6-N-acetylglucosamine synthase-like glycosyltransferase